MMRLTGLVSRNPFKQRVTEASDVDNVAKKIARLTDNNNHTEAICELAKFVGDKKWITICNSISAIHDAEGSMPIALLKYRNEIYDRLINAVGHKFGTPTKAKIASAF